MAGAGTLTLREAACIYCGGCAAVCPEYVFRVFAAHLEMYSPRCTLCGECVRVCPTGALDIA